MSGWVVELQRGLWLVNSSTGTLLRKNAAIFTTKAEAQAALDAFTGTGKTKATIYKA